jgi:transposase
MGMQAQVIDITKLVAQNEALLAENTHLRARVEQLTEQVAHLSKYLFGRKSERLQPGQLDLFRTGEAAKACATFGEEQEVVTTRRKKKAGGHGRGSLPEHLEHLEHLEHWLDLAEDKRFCSVCGGLCQKIGEEVTERAHFVPATFVVNRYVRPKYGCPHGHEIKTADLPDGVVRGSKFDASVHAHLVVAKFLDHLPLNRLQGIFGRYGIKLPRQTMWDLLVRVDELVAQPILVQMKKELLEETHLHADESPVKLRVEGEKQSKQGWVWAWRNEPGIRASKPPPGEPPRRSKVLIEFHPGRGKKIPEQFLGDWSNTLICDGHRDYTPVTLTNGITRAGCWAHVRRPFRDQLEKSPKWAAQPLFLINRLFALERAVRNRAERLDLDQAEALELLAAVRARSSTPRRSPKSGQ